MDRPHTRLRKESTDLRRSLALYQEAGGGTVLPLPGRSTPEPPAPS
ncbi:hypothetical protein [Streptomyces canus]